VLLEDSTRTRGELDVQDDSVALVDLEELGNYA
jgi:hypothetical protein